MFEYKLQVGCLVLVLYFIISYLKHTVGTKLPCNRIFDAILVIAPWAIVFDGLTAWTVNHMQIVSEEMNLFFHGVFFILMDSCTILIFLYMLYQTIGIKSNRQFMLYSLPGALSILLILCALPNLYYIQGETTNYSMGISVITCYVSVVLHFLAIFILICTRHRTIETHKILSIIYYMALALAILILQMIFPETLISSLVPTMAVIGIYISFEDPSLRKLKMYNAEMVAGFATLVENRDNSTGGHIKRTRGYVEILLNQMKKHGRYKKILTRDYIENVVNAAPMHDIGKIATADSILQKTSGLTDEEYEIMKQHTSVGGDIIMETFQELEDPEYQHVAYDLARYHHEKWNGKGYPDGLKYQEIPLHARVMSIADVFDAVSADRCYRDAIPTEECFEIIRQGSGKEFDPELVEIFMEAKEEIIRYCEKTKRDK